MLEINIIRDINTTVSISICGFIVYSIGYIVVTMVYLNILL
jgi:hypothetical protein